MINGTFLPSTFSTGATSRRDSVTVMQATSSQVDNYTDTSQITCAQMPNLTGDANTVYTPVRLVICPKQMTSAGTVPASPVYKFQRVRAGVATDLTTNINWPTPSSDFTITTSTAFVGGVTLKADDVVNIVYVSGTGSDKYVFEVNLEMTYTA